MGDAITWRTHLGVLH